MNTPSKLTALALLASVALGSASAQTVWDGNTNPNNSGDWLTGANWSTNNVPAAAANVQLNDVTSGNRTVTLNNGATNTTVNSLSLTQSTTTSSPINTFELQSALTLSAITGFNTTLGAGVDVSQLVTTLSGNGRIILGAGGAENVAMINRGTFNLTNGPASGNAAGFIARNQVAANRDLAFQNFGILNLASSGTPALSDGGAVIGGLGTAERRYDTVVTNSGTINVAGLGTIGTVNTSSTSNGGATLTNNDGGTVNIGDGGTLQLASRSNSNGSKTALVTNAQGGTINLGVSGNAASNGRLVLTHRTNSAFSGSADAPTVNNSGTLNLHGTSRVEFVQFTNLTTQFDDFIVNNTATGVINLSDAARIGNTAKNTLLTNAGLLTKAGDGTAEIQSAASGTFANTGTIYLRGGALDVTSAINSTGGDLRFDLGNASFASARLLAPSITLSGSNLELVFTSTLSGDLSFNLWDATVSGTFDEIILSGSGFGGTYTTSDFSSNGYDFSLNYATGVLTATVIPEPSSFAALAGLGVLGLAALRRRRRA